MLHNTLMYVTPCYITFICYVACYITCNNTQHFAFKEYKNARGDHIIACDGDHIIACDNTETQFPLPKTSDPENKKQVEAGCALLLNPDGTVKQGKKTKVCLRL